MYFGRIAIINNGKYIITVELSRNPLSGVLTVGGTVTEITNSEENNDSDEPRPGLIPSDF